MTQNYEDAPSGPPKKPGMPGWAWGLIGCAVLSPLVLVLGMGAMLFPVFGQAREKARQTSCLSNCKQMSVGVLMYTQDYDETLPPKEAKWVDLMEEYNRNPEVYRCPSYTSSPFGYAMNSEPLGKKMEKIAAPETTYLLFDSDVSGPNTLATPTAVAYRHKGYGNIGFVDGHAKSMEKSTGN